MPVFNRGRKFEFPQKEGRKEGASSKLKPFIFRICKISASVTKYHHRYIKARLQDKKKKKNPVTSTNLCAGGT